MIPFLYATTLSDIKRGNFPLTHDCILKVEYIHCTPISRQYFTCSVLDSSAVIDILSKVGPVFRVDISSVDDFGITFLTAVNKK